MRVFHRTPHGQKIINEGFLDGEGTYMTGVMHRGVWLSDRPLDICEGAKGNDLLTLDIPENVLTPYEWNEGGTPYREFLLPAEVVNFCGPPTLCDDDDFDWMQPTWEAKEIDQ
ncbi:MAG: hypothetical protein CMJ47_06315 [Planctomyces sp.]|nr:hypothetical protein [Planctomyces sp.]